MRRSPSVVGGCVLISFFCVMSANAQSSEGVDEGVEEVDASTTAVSASGRHHGGEPIAVSGLIGGVWSINGGAIGPVYQLGLHFADGQVALRAGRMDFGDEEEIAGRIGAGIEYAVLSVGGGKSLPGRPNVRLMEHLGIGAYRAYGGMAGGAEAKTRLGLMWATSVSHQTPVRPLSVYMEGQWHWADLPQTHWFGLLLVGIQIHG